MPVPKRRLHRSRRGKRRSHDALTKPTWTKCSHCGESKRPHCVCPSCGYYNNREVIAPKDANYAS